MRVTHVYSPIDSIPFQRKYECVLPYRLNSIPADVYSPIETKESVIAWTLAIHHATVAAVLATGVSVQATALASARHGYCCSTENAFPWEVEGEGH